MQYAVKLLSDDISELLMKLWPQAKHVSLKIVSWMNIFDT